MKLKFNKFERVAGLFVVTALVGAVAVTLFVAVKKGFFEGKVHYKTVFKFADGISPGTQVQFSGLKIGTVDDVEFLDEGVVIDFFVYEKYSGKIREDSLVRTLRPFIIGDKVLEVITENKASKVAANGSMLQSLNTTDIMDLLGGRSMTNYLEEVSGLFKNLRIVLQAFTDPKRSKDFIDMFDHLNPTIKNMNKMSVEMTKMSKQMTRKQYLRKTLQNLVETTDNMNQLLPEMSKVVTNYPQLIPDMVKTLENLTLLTEEMTTVLPAIAEVAPDLPRASRRAIEALDEAVVVLKAMQKSFLLKGAVADVKDEEEALKKLEKEREDRRPAGDWQRQPGFW